MSAVGTTNSSKVNINSAYVEYIKGRMTPGRPAF